MARKKKDASILPEGWQKKILGLYKEGASDVEIKAYLATNIGSFSNDLWNRFLDEETEFSQTIKKGRILAQSWWERHGRLNINDKNFNSTLWYMNMKNRYSWQDKSEIKFEGDLNAEVIIR